MWSQIALGVRETYNTNQSNRVSYKQYHNNFKSNFFDRKQHDWKPWEVKMQCDYQDTSESILPQRTQKISSANKAWDGISWSWEQSRQLCLFWEKNFHILFPFKWFTTLLSLSQQPQFSKSPDQAPHYCMQTGNEIFCWWSCWNSWRYLTFLFRLHLKGRHWNPRNNIFQSCTNSFFIHFGIKILPRQTTLPIPADLVLNLTFTQNIRPKTLCTCCGIQCEKAALTSCPQKSNTPPTSGETIHVNVEKTSRQGAEHFTDRKPDGLEHV